MEHRKNAGPRLYTRIAILAAVMGQCLFAVAAGAVGQSGAQFLKIPVGPKATSMGGAFTAVADDASAEHWNPAGLTLLRSPQALGVSSLWLADVTYQYFSLAVPAAGGTVAASVLYSGSRDLTGRDVDFRETGTYGAQDLAAGLSWALTAGSNLGLGLGARVLQQKIEKSTATAVAMNIGVLWGVPVLRGLRLGLALRNLGSRPRFIDDPAPLPTIVSGGAGYRHGSLILAADLEKPRFEDASIHIGGEYRMAEALSLRAGWRTRPGLGATASFGTRLLWHGLSVEYAYLPFPEIEGTHTFGLGIGLR